MLESNCIYICDESNEANLTCTLLQMKQMVDEAIDLAYELEDSSVACKGVGDDLLATWESLCYCNAAVHELIQSVLLERKETLRFDELQMRNDEVPGRPICR